MLCGAYHYFPRIEVFENVGIKGHYSQLLHHGYTVTSGIHCIFLTYVIHEYILTAKLIRPDVVVGSRHQIPFRQSQSSGATVAKIISRKGEVIVSAIHVVTTHVKTIESKTNDVFAVVSRNEELVYACLVAVIIEGEI